MLFRSVSQCSLLLNLAAANQSSTSALTALRDKPVIRDKFLFKPPETAPGVILIGQGSASFQGAVVNARGDLVNPKDLNQECFLRNRKTTSILPRRHVVDGIVLTIAHRWQDNYFHWLFDILPKLAVAEALAIRFTHLHVATHHSYQRQSLSRLGIDPAMIIHAERGEQVQASTLVAVMNQDAFTSIPAWACQFLRDRFLSMPARRGERLYVSRADAPRRRIRNEQQVITWLVDMGFRIVEAGRLDFAGQIELFAAADIIIGAHGAGLAKIGRAHV